MLQRLLSLFLLVMVCHLLAPLAAMTQQYNESPEFIKANSVWAFGKHAGFNFNTAVYGPLYTAINSSEGNASVADPITGNLLFYSDGNRCWNSAGQVMPNGNGLLGNGMGNANNNFAYGVSTTQGCCIVPVIGQPGKYYLFSLCDEGNIMSTGSLFYSVVDMSLDNGMGDIVGTQKNISLSNISLSEAMIAIPGDNCDIWLMVHEYTFPAYQAYHITSQGIDPNPVVSVTGPQVMGWDTMSAVGGMAVSPDRSRIAMAVLSNYEDLEGVQLTVFDPGTGVVSAPLYVAKGLNAYTVAFSPNSKKLYMASSVTAPPGGGIIQLYQFTIDTYDSALITASRIAIDGQPTNTYNYCYLKLYNDTIYVNTMPSTDNPLGRINRPDLDGLNCYYEPAAIPFANNTGNYFSLPNEVVFPLPPDTIYQTLGDTVLCRSNASPDGINLVTAGGFSDYYWDDGSLAPTRVISEPGKYWVRYREDFCHYHVDTFPVSLSSLSFSLGTDRDALCSNISVYNLGVNITDAVAFTWQDGGTGPVYEVKEKGYYSVTVRNQDGCEAADTVYIGFKDFDPHLKDTVLCNDQLIGIRVDIPLPAGAQVLWSNGNTQASVTLRDTGTYWVTVMDPVCAVTDTMSIYTEVCECRYLVPGAFTPNGDGHNDFFMPVIEPGCSVKGFVCNIYNRYGQRVYNGSRYDQGWDGRYYGMDADAGTYFYEVRFVGGTKEVPYYKKGDLVLIR